MVHPAKKYLLAVAIVIFSNQVCAQSTPPRVVDSSVATNPPVHLPALAGSLIADRNKVYVNEQLSVTVLVRVPKTAFNLRQEKLLVEGADVFKLEKHVEDITYNNLPYQLQKSSYAIFFKQPGTYKLPALRMTATLPVSAGGTNSDSNPKIQTHTKVQEITVTKAPASADKWLAAREVTAAAEWNNEDKSLEFVVGQPVARIYTVNINGQFPTAIPELEFPVPEQIRLYKSTPVIQKHADKRGIGGLYSQVINLIPGQAGTFEIPAMTIRWWDINQQQWQKTEIVAESISVRQQSTGNTIATGKSSTYNKALVYVLGATTALLSILCLFLWYRLRHLKRSLFATHNYNAPDKLQPPRISEKKAWSNLKRSAHSGHPQQVRQAIVAWYATIKKTHSPVRLDQLGQCDNSLEQTLATLDAEIYQTESNPPLSNPPVLNPPLSNPPLPSAFYQNLIAQLGSLRKKTITRNILPRYSTKSGNSRSTERLYPDRTEGSAR